MGDTQKTILAYPLYNRLAFLSLGPNGTYYARGLEILEHPWAGRWEGSGDTPISYELPQSLTSDTWLAEKLTKRETQVWLGRHGSWVVHWNEGTSLHPYDMKWDVRWHLNDVDLYPGLEKFLRAYKTVLEEIEGTEEDRRYLRRKICLTVSFYPLTRSIPVSCNAPGRHRALAIRQRNNC